MGAALPWERGFWEGDGSTGVSSREGDGRGGPELMVEFRGGVGRDLLSECPLQNSRLRWDGPRMKWCFLSSEVHWWKIWALAFE